MTERWLCARFDWRQRGACAIDYAKGLQTPFPDSFRVGDDTPGMCRARSADPVWPNFVPEIDHFLLLRQRST